MLYFNELSPEASYFHVAFTKKQDINALLQCRPGGQCALTGSTTFQLSIDKASRTNPQTFSSSWCHSHLGPRIPRDSRCAKSVHGEPIRDAVTYTEHAHRKTVTGVDVLFAFKPQGRILYGFEL
ncbi:Histone-fold [Phytophthora cactorum]|nr:Histone-fold [Phytophthora cactorum]